jgi:hypothetical protein
VSDTCLTPNERPTRKIEWPVASDQCRARGPEIRGAASTPRGPPTPDDRARFIAGFPPAARRSGSTGRSRCTPGS